MGSHPSNDFTALWAQHDLGEVVVSAKEVHDRVLELGRQITVDYAKNPPLLVCVLKGAINFMSDLMRAIELPVESISWRSPHTARRPRRAGSCAS